MDNLISIPNDTSLKTLAALGKKLEEVLQEQFGIYKMMKKGYRGN